MATYENMTIIQYDRGSLGEFICLSLYKKYFGESLYDSKRKNGLGWYFQKHDSLLDGLMYDYHRPNIESVNIQRSIFGTCIYEEILAGNYETARNISHAMINYRKLNRDTDPTDILIFYLPQPDYTYDSSSKLLTRMHVFDDIDLTQVYPGAEIVNVFCPPEKRWIFKFLFMYKKKLDAKFNMDQRFSDGVDNYWNFNWSRNLTPKDGLINLNCYELFLGNTNDLIGAEYSTQLLDNFAENVSMLEAHNLDYTRDNVSSDELLAIVKNIYSNYA